MEIICDTNVWYNISNGNISIKEIDEKVKLIGIFLSLREFSKSPNLSRNTAMVRNAIIAMMKYSSNINFYPPFIYLKKLDEPDFIYDPFQKNLQTLKAVELINQGWEPDDDKIVIYEKFLQEQYNKFKKASDKFNELVTTLIKPNIKEKKMHRRIVINNPNRLNGVVNNYVKWATNTDGLSKDFNWKSIELFINVVREFLLTIDLSTMKIAPNDWFDMFNLLYVQPGYKYWTFESRWINLIKTAGMDHYLYQLNKK